MFQHLGVCQNLPVVARSCHSERIQSPVHLGNGAGMGSGAAVGDTMVVFVTSCCFASFSLVKSSAAALLQHTGEEDAARIAMPSDSLVDSGF